MLRFTNVSERGNEYEKEIYKYLIKCGDGAVNVIGARDGGDGGRRLREPVS